MPPDAPPEPAALPPRARLRAFAQRAALTPAERAELLALVDALDAEASRYAFLARIGAGGMGEVWRVHDRALGRDLAMKILRPERNLDPEKRARFLSEAQATAQL